MHNCHIRRHLDARPNRKSKCSVSMYRIALLGWLRGVRGPLFAIPTLGIAKVVSLHIEELHLMAELLKNEGTAPYSVASSADCRTPYISMTS